MESHNEIRMGEVTGHLRQNYEFTAEKIFDLSGSELLIGRNHNAQIKVFSPKVSRNHCYLRHTAKGWTVVDNSSFNGVYINSKKLEPNVPYLLKHGHRIYFGPPEDVPQSFTYLSSGRESLKSSVVSGKDVLKDRNTAGDEDKADILVSQRLSCLENITPTKKSVELNIQCKTLSKKRKPHILNIASSEIADSDVCNLYPRRKKVKTSSNETPQFKSPTIKVKVNKKTLNSPFASSPTLRECMDALDRRLKESAKIEAQVREVMIRSEACLNKCRSQEANIKNEISEDDNSQSLLTTTDDFFIGADPYPFSQPLEDDQCFFQQDVSEISVPIVDEKNLQTNDPKGNLEERFAKLQEELDEKNLLQLQLEKALSEKNDLLKKQEVMTKDKENLTSELESAKCYQQSMKEEVTSQFGNLMEAEFTCGICTELFVKAVTLDCSHTFCEKCITEWKKKKKQCPICRTKTSGETRSLVIDNFIERMVEKLSLEYQERRKEVVKDRLNYSKNKPVCNKKRKRKTSIRTRTRRRPVEITINSEPDILDIMAMPEDDDSDNLNSYWLGSDSDSSVDGYGIYGGFGRCFNCGRRGHWANGCPDQ